MGGLVAGSGEPPVRRARETAFEGGVTAEAGGDARAECDDGGRPPQPRMPSFGIDLESLAMGARLVRFPGGPLPVHNLVRFG